MKHATLRRQVEKLESRARKAGLLVEDGHAIGDISPSTRDAWVRLLRDVPPCLMFRGSADCLRPLSVAEETEVRNQCSAMADALEAGDTFNSALDAAGELALKVLDRVQVWAATKAGDTANLTPRQAAIAVQLEQWARPNQP